MINVSYGDQRKALLILRDYIHDRDSVQLRWNDACNAVITSQILDFSRLGEISECDRKIELLNCYISHSIKYKLFFSNQVPELKAKLGILDQHNESVKAYMTGIIQKDSAQKIFFIPFINAHIEYGNNLLTIVGLLKAEEGKWKIENHRVIFKKSGCQVIYNETLNEAVKNEEKINEFSDKLRNGI